jgi:DNA-binding beta-propeller fold protein YncE
LLFLFLVASVGSFARDKKGAANPPPPELLLDGGRKLAFERSFSIEKDVKLKTGFWAHVVNVIAGEPNYRYLVKPYGIAVDSKERIIITDPGAGGFHIFDFTQQKYKFVTRQEKGKDPSLFPQCIALDAADNIYISDSQTGKVFVYEPSGKLRQVIGSLKGGEGFFKRPTGLAVDSAALRIYVTDTSRDQVFVMDMQGNVQQVIGKRGTAEGEFNFPTELLLRDQELYVVDAMNFRVQVFDLSGAFVRSVGRINDGPGGLFRPKGISIDSEGHLYIVDGQWGVVQVFNVEGQLLYYFGTTGSELGQFQLPAGIFIDRQDRLYVVDSINHRVQVFRYYAAQKAEGVKP